MVEIVEEYKDIIDYENTYQIRGCHTSKTYRS